MKTKKQKPFVYIRIVLITLSYNILYKYMLYIYTVILIDLN